MNYASGGDATPAHPLVEALGLNSSKDRVLYELGCEAWRRWMFYQEYYGWDD